NCQATCFTYSRFQLSLRLTGPAPTGTTGAMPYAQMKPRTRPRTSVPTGRSFGPTPWLMRNGMVFGENRLFIDSHIAENWPFFRGHGPDPNNQRALARRDSLYMMLMHNTTGPPAPMFSNRIHRHPH